MQKKPRITKVCDHCHTSFEVPDYRQDQHYCSHECYSKSMLARVQKICEQCGKLFEARLSKKERRYCSKACDIQAKTTRTPKACEYCGMMFDLRVSVPDQRYCSSRCSGLAHRTRIQKTCENCGKGFEITAARAQSAQHCSKACQAMKVALVCLICGKPFYVKRSDAQVRETCSRQCQIILKQQRGRMPTRGRPLTEDERQRIGQSLQRYYQENPTRHHWYIDGTHTNGQLRRGPSWEQQRKRARERDGHTCRICGKTTEQEGKNLAVHHIIRYAFFESHEEANDLENLLTVCQSCHMKLEHEQIALISHSNGSPP